jgi:hypothetical protein
LSSAALASLLVVDALHVLAWHALPRMTVFGKVARLKPRRNKENRRGYRVTPIAIFDKAGR